VCNIQWSVGVSNSSPIAVYTLSSRYTFNEGAGSVGEDVGDERYGDRSVDNSHLVTSNPGIYRHLDLGTQFQNTAHSNEGVGSPWTDRSSSGSFPVHTVLFFQTPKLVNT
jgi:hypothetical protein